VTLHMLPCSCCVGGAPGHVLPCVGAGGVGDSKMTEREHARHVILGTSLCNTGGNGNILHWARREGSVAAVPPVVGHHRVVAVHHSGTPGDRGGGVGALVVLHTKVVKGEDTLRTIVGVARIWYTN